MTSHVRSQVSPASWGLPLRRRPGGALRGLLDGTVLLALWMALWTVFVLGVVEPAARLRAGEPRGAEAERSRS